MRRRIVLASVLALITAAVAWAQFSPKTLTVEPLGMTGTPSPVATFKPKTLRVETLGMTGPPQQAPTFRPKTLTVEPLGMTGTPTSTGGPP